MRKLLLKAIILKQEFYHKLGIKCFDKIFAWWIKILNKKGITAYLAISAYIAIIVGIIAALIIIL
jgi:hypothetical protein